jgi:calcineurin-like phosphoesterase family protein
MHLIAGNHDRCHPSNGVRSSQFEELYRNVGGVESLTTNTSLTLDNGTQVTVSHFPYPTAGVDERADRVDRYADWRPVDDGSWLLCGHAHQRWRHYGRMINVGVDAWGGRPVSEAELVELLTSGPDDRDCLPWQR